MIYYVIATHGFLANALVETTKLIIGDVDSSKFYCLNMTIEKSMDQFIDEAKLVLNAHKEDQFLIFVDLFGASPCNSCLSVFRYADYRMIAGVNLPIMLEALLSSSEDNLIQLWERLQEVGHESIRGVFLPATLINKDGEDA